MGEQAGPVVLETLAFVRLGGLFVVHHGAESPTPDEFETMFHGFANPEDPAGALLVSSDGAALSPAERRRVGRFLSESRARCAVLTNSVVVRGVLAAIGWFSADAQTRAFAPDELDAALDYLQLTAREAQDARAALDELRAARKNPP